jgi:hypothetical protein
MRPFLHNAYFLAAGMALAVGFWMVETLAHVYLFSAPSWPDALLPLDDPNELWMRGLTTLLFIGFGAHAQRLVDRRRDAERQREELIAQLEKSLEEIRTLRGILPICGHCKKIRNDKGYWEGLESYLGKHAQIDFTHGVCPDCAAKFYSEFI